MNLTDEQLKIVYSNCRINLAQACPGSGKSTVLVARAERLWNEFKEPILIATFSNDAVRDITKKLNGDLLPHIKVQTIHSFCFGIVKEYWHVLKEVVGGDDSSKEPVLINKLKELELIHEIWPDVDGEKVYDSHLKLKEFGLDARSLIRLFKKGIYLGKFSQSDLENWERYEHVRLSRGWIDFDDMTELASMIMTIPEVSNGVSRKYFHILIDEAQDTSESQITALRPLITHCKTCLCVYDKNQAIYSFRGADGFILDTLGYLNEAVVFRLSESFRNGSLVAKFANKIVRDKSSQIKTVNPQSLLKFNKFQTKEQEIDYVLNKADKESAIISRTNFYLEQFERECIKRGINYRGTGFYRSDHIKELHRFISESNDSNVIPLIDRAFLENASYTKIEKEDFKLVTNLIKKEGLDAFKKLVTTSVGMNNEGLIMTTGHRAKGLQWPKVFVVGAHSGHIPHRLSKDDAEERNLFYVMVTREAGSGLEISYVEEPSKYLKEFGVA